MDILIRKKCFAFSENYEMACLCSMCPSKFLTLALLRNHLKRYHKLENNFHVVCQAPRCASIYHSFEGYKSHLRRKHANILNNIIDAADNIPANNEDPPQDANQAMNISEDDADGNSEAGKVKRTGGVDRDVDNDGYANSNIGQKEENIRKMNANYLLGTKELHKLTQKSVNTIVTNTTSIVQNSLELVRCRLLSMLDNDGSGIPEVREFLDNLLTEENVVTNPFLGMETKWQQDNIFRDLFGVVVSFGKLVLEIHTLVNASPATSHVPWGLFIRSQIVGAI